MAPPCLASYGVAEMRPNRALGGITAWASCACPSTSSASSTSRSVESGLRTGVHVFQGFAGYIGPVDRKSPWAGDRGLGIAIVENFQATG